MRVAGFEQAPHAHEAAAILREHEYDVEIVMFDGSADPHRIGDLCEVIRDARWAKALLISNCEGEYFGQIVTDNFGSVVWEGRIVTAA